MSVCHLAYDWGSEVDAFRVRVCVRIVCGLSHICLSHSARISAPRRRPVATAGTRRRLLRRRSGTPRRRRRAGHAGSKGRPRQEEGCRRFAPQQRQRCADTLGSERSRSTAPTTGAPIAAPSHGAERGDERHGHRHRAGRHGLDPADAAAAGAGHHHFRRRRQPAARGALLPRLRRVAGQRALAGPRRLPERRAHQRGLRRRGELGRDPEQRHRLHVGRQQQPVVRLERAGRRRSASS